MWTRVELKDRAKQVLKNSYWKALLASFIILIAVGSSGSPGFSWNFGGRSGSGNTSLYGTDTKFLVLVAGLLLVIVAIIFIAALAFRIFIGFPLEVGGRRYFIKAAENRVNLNEVGFAFKKGIYIEIVKAMAWRALFNILWFLLFLIPGIVKAYAYSMVPYILADNPEIGYDRALKLSMDMTYGEKGNIFVLDLSFLGWYLLGLCACFIGAFFLLPYINATKAELYLTLRKNAIEANITSYEELRINPIVNY